MCLRCSNVKNNQDKVSKNIGMFVMFYYQKLMIYMINISNNTIKSYPILFIINIPRIP